MAQTFSFIIFLGCFLSFVVSQFDPPSSQNGTELSAYLTDMSNDGTILIAGTINETIELYLVDERGTLNLQEVLDVDKIYDAIDVSQNGNLVALAVNQTVEIFNITGNETFLMLDSIQNITLSNSQFAISVSFSETNEILLVGQKSGKLYIFSYQDQYVQFQTLLVNDEFITVMMPINDSFVTGDKNGILRIYDVEGNGTTLKQQIDNNSTIDIIKISHNQKYIYTLSGNILKTYYYWNETYTFIEQIQLMETSPTSFLTCSDGLIIFGGNNESIIQSYSPNYDRTHSLSEISNISGGVESLSADEDCKRITIFTQNQTITVKKKNPVEQDTIIQQQQQVPKKYIDCKNKVLLTNGQCGGYCSQKCQGCVYTIENCTECSEYFMKKSSGIGCEPTTASQISRHSRTFLQVMLNKPMKIFSFLLGDLRLYEYHKRNYEGELGKMMSLIRHLENQQWEMMKFDGYSDKIDKIVDDMPSYADYSNKKFMELQRRDEFFFRSAHQFFFYYLPLIIITFFVVNRLFRILFHFQISKHIRIFSFWGYLFELAMKSNIQILTFLAFRQFLIPFSFDFRSKIYLALTIMSFWIIIFFAIAGYYLYFYLYSKLSKYFLVNNYRIKSAFSTNMFVYGLRPIFKGVVHSLCYDYYAVQISLLLAIELVTIVLLCIIEFTFGSHRKKFILFFEIGFYSCFAILNGFLLFTYFYEDIKMTEQLTMLVYLMFALISVRLVLDFIPTECGKKKQQQEIELQQISEEKDKKKPMIILNNSHDYEVFKKRFQTIYEPDNFQKQHAAIERIRNEKNEKKNNATLMVVEEL